MACTVLQDLVSLSRRKISFSFDKQHWHLQLEAQELGSRVKKF